MGTKLHEILAAEKTVLAQSNLLLTETAAKLGKDHFFSGHNKSLKLFVESPSNFAVEAAAKDVKILPTTVVATLDYGMGYWARSENLLFQKNKTNQLALANIEIDGQVFIKDVSVDELLGLETRLETLRKLFQTVPTLDASKEWVLAPDLGPNIWRSVNAEITVKTEKVLGVFELSKATEKFPAQVKEISKDEAIGEFKVTRTSGAITSAAKAELLTRTDTLIMEVKKARTRANNIDVVPVSIGKELVSYLLAPLLVIG